MWPVASGPLAPAKCGQCVPGVGGRGWDEEVWIRQSGTEIGHACRDVVGNEALDGDAPAAVLVVESSREEVYVRLHRRDTVSVKCICDSLHIFLSS